MLPVIIRAADLQDGVLLAKLACQLGYEIAVPEMINRLKSVLPDKEQAVYVAEIDRQVVGWIHVAVYKTLIIEDQVAVLGLVVDKEFNRVGIGRKLVRKAEEWAENLGCSCMVVKSNAKRQGAHRFYEKLAYQNVKTQYVFTKVF